MGNNLKKKSIKKSTKFRDTEKKLVFARGGAWGVKWVKGVKME